MSYSQLVAIADRHDWSKKTYNNNSLSVLRRAFDFGYKDRPLEANPARAACEARACAKRIAPGWIPFACTMPKS